MTVELSDEELSRVKKTIDRIERLIPWLDGQKRHLECHALAYEHEIERLTEERAILKMTMTMGDINGRVETLIESLSGLAETVASSVAEPPKEPEP